ncbi:MAG: NAD(P)H-binding protein, partial [Clostridiales bacterium]|nr:NAD(P)H-binding protein [Clostridiales bacterium]
MKIAVIGANGKQGNLIAREAKMRWHEVTAIVRDPAKVEGKGYAHVLKRDIYDLTADDVKDFDAVVNAFGLPFGQDNKLAYQRSTEHLIKVFERVTHVRLLVVGGAGSLYMDPARKHNVLETIPEAFRADPADMAAAFVKLRESQVNWTFFSPASLFDFDGAKTGKYTIGSDYVITNASNESYISYADYSIAMVDEIENGFHIRKRFTAVSDNKPPEPVADKTPEPANDYYAYYGIFDKEPEYEGMSQFRPPFNFELTGKEYKLVMDNGTDYNVKFMDGHTLEWSKYSEPSTRQYYECAKGEELTYLVNFELAGEKPRKGITLILDLEQRLVTYASVITGFSEKYPYLIEPEFIFGAIDIPGYPLPEKRHGYTTDLVGKRIRWQYTPYWNIIHVYYSANYMRVAFDPSYKPKTPPTPEEIAEFQKYPYDEPVWYIKIKEGVYV